MSRLWASHFKPSFTWSSPPSRDNVEGSRFHADSCGRGQSEGPYQPFNSERRTSIRHIGYRWVSKWFLFMLVQFIIVRITEWTSYIYIMHIWFNMSVVPRVHSMYIAYTSCMGVLSCTYFVLRPLFLVTVFFSLFTQSPVWSSQSANEGGWTFSALDANKQYRYSAVTRPTTAVQDDDEDEGD